jgi:polar amino acid transport system substrate-binding protein
MNKHWPKPLVLLLIAAVVACAPNTVRTPENGPIRFGVDSTPFPPFSVPDASGKWTGFEVDLMDAVCAEMKANCVIVPTPWDALIADLESGKIDVIWSSMTVTRARTAVIDFSDPYYATRSVLLAPRAMTLNPDQPRTLEGMRIAVFPAQETYARQHFTSAREIVRVDPDAHDGQLDVIMAYAHADAIFLDQFIADAFLKTASRGNIFAVLWTAPLDPSLLAPVAAGLRQSDGDLRERLNAALQAVHASGQFKQLSARYFDYDISPR